MLIYSNDSIFSIGCLNICSSSVRLCSHSRYRPSRYNQFFYVVHYFHVHPLAATRKSRCQKLVTALCQCQIQEIFLNMRCHETILDTRQSRATGFSFLFFPAYFVVCAFFILLSEFFFCWFIVNEWGIMLQTSIPHKNCLLYMYYLCFHMPRGIRIYTQESNQT